METIRWIRALLDIRRANDAFDLESWRIWLINILALVMVLMIMPFSLALTFPIFIAQHSYFLIGLDCLVYAMALWHIAHQGQTIMKSGFYWVCLLFLMAFSFLIILGPHYARSGWLVLCVVIVAVFFGVRAAFVATAILMFALLSLYPLMDAADPAWYDVYQKGWKHYFIYVFNISMLCLAASLPVGFLLKRLSRALALERDSTQALAEERNRLLSANQALVTEINKRRQVEAALRSLQDNVPLGIYRSSAEGQLLAGNPALATMLGLSTVDDLLTMNFEDLYENSGDRTRLLKQLASHEFIQGYETRFKKPGDGEAIWVSINARGLTDENGTLQFIDGIIEDISENKQAQEALRTSEEKYRLLAENVNDVIWTMDMDLNYTYISPAIEKIQGWNMEEVASLTINDVLTPKSLEIAVKRIAAHMTEGAKKGDYSISDRFELEMYCKDGSTIWTEIVASSILGWDGQPVGILGVTRDITERKKLETQLQRAQKMEAIGTLAGGVAHDLNNVLSAQVSYPDLILMDLPEGSPLKNPILTIKKSGEKAAAIVQDLLTLARRGVVATEVVNFNTIIDDYIKSPECENLMAFHTDVKIKTDLEPYLLNIMGSSVHLSTTVMNLVSNAAEAMFGGGNISISTRSKYIDKPVRGYEDVEEGDYVVVTVSDTGTGISSGDLEKIFEPFYTKKVMGRSGTGLGMAVVWGTVKDHKGYIDVQSIEGKGTTFTVYFPATRKEIGIKEETLLMEAYIGKGESILVVDDIAEQREIAFRILNKLNYSVTSVSSGEEAVDYLKNNSTDLLVLDMIMDPGIDGLETYKKILELHPEQKAIIASGFSETDMVKEAQRLGAGKYIKKPYTLEKIGLTVKEELEK